MNCVPDFSFARIYRQPFPHTWLPHIFSNSVNDQVLCWLEEFNQWTFTTKNFYKQHEFSLKVQPPPAELAFLTSSYTLQTMSNWLQEEFEIKGLKPTDVVAHRLESNQGIGIHNDQGKYGEKIRLLLQLNQRVTGGELALFQDHRPESVCRIIRPIHGTAVAFAISNISYHAVTKVKEGRRFTIIYSFRS